MIRLVRCAPAMTAPRQVLPGKTWLVTRRCSERRRFLRPSAIVNEIFLFVLGVAARRYGLEVHAFCVMSNHYHQLVTDPAARLPAFVQYLTLVNPLRYAIDIVHLVYLEGAGLGPLLPDLWPLTLIAAVTLSVASWMFRHRLA